MPEKLPSITLLKQTQVDALVQLMGSGRMSEPMRNAVAMVLVEGSTQQAASEKHGVSPQGLFQRITNLRRVMRLSYVALVGGEPSEEASTQVIAFDPTFEKRWLEVT